MTFVLQTNAPPVPYGVGSLCFLIFLDARADVQFHRLGTSLFFSICRFAESESVVGFVVFTTETVNILEKQNISNFVLYFLVGFFPHGPSLANVFWGLRIRIRFFFNTLLIKQFMVSGKGINLLDPGGTIFVNVVNARISTVCSLLVRIIAARPPNPEFDPGTYCPSLPSVVHEWQPSEPVPGQGLLSVLSW